MAWPIGRGVLTSPSVTGSGIECPDQAPVSESAEIIHAKNFSKKTVKAPRLGAKLTNCMWKEEKKPILEKLSDNYYDGNFLDNFLAKIVTWNLEFGIWVRI
jgi:hypothetical protein